MKKKILVGVIIVIMVVFLIPFPYYYKDGGTVEYHAVLYSVTNYHSIKTSGGYDTGIQVKILGMTLYDNTTYSIHI